MVLLFPVLLTVHPLSNFLLSSNAFPPTMTFGDFFLTKSLVISLHHPFIYPALQQIFSGRIFVYWTGWESKVSKKQFPSSSSFSVDALDLALAANECACQIMNWIHHLSITFWKSLSLVGCAIALVWIGREGWEPFVFSSDAPSENAWPADWEPYIHHLLPWPEWERWEGNLSPFLVRPGNHMCAPAGCRAFVGSNMKSLLFVARRHCDSLSLPAVELLSPC